MQSSTTRELAKFIIDLQINGINNDVLKHVKLCILDTIGVGLFGSTLKWNKILMNLIEDQGGNAESYIWSSKIKTSCSNSALVNGTMVHGFELDDTHKEAIVHPGSVVIPAAFAIVERKGNVSGEKLLAAIVAGYESVIRIGTCIGTSHLMRGYHPTGTCGVFGSAAAAGKLLDLNEDEMVHALGIAGSMGSGLMAAQHGAMVKRLHAGRACQGGVIAALLAERGFTGITNVLEAEYGGFCSTMADRFDINKITNKLNTEFKMLEVGFKPYSCAASNHTSIDAVKYLINKHQINYSDVNKVIIRSTTATKTHVGWAYDPAGVVAAQMNIPYAIAVTLLEGDAFVNQYTEKKIKDSTIINYTKKIEVLPDKEIDKKGAKYRHAVIVKIILNDGRKFNKKMNYSKGSPQNPLSHFEIISKYKRLTGLTLSKNKAEKILDAVKLIERLDNALLLTSLLKK